MPKKKIKKAVKSKGLPEKNRVRKQPVQAEPVQAEPVQAEPVQAEPVQAEPVQAEPVQAEPVQAEPVQTEPVQAEPVQAEPVQAEPVQAEPTPEPVKRSRVNSLLNELIEPTDKDLKGIADKAKAIGDVYEEADIEPDADGKIEIDDKQLRAEARLRAVLHVAGVSFGLAELGGLINNKQNTSRYEPNPKGKEQLEKSLGDYYFLKSKLDKKRRDPKGALIGLASTVILPPMFAIIIDAIRNYKERKVKAEDEQREKALQEQERIFAMFKDIKSEPEIKTEQPQARPQAKPQNRPEKKDPVKGKSKKGRHSLSCPKHKDPTANCTCK